MPQIVASDPARLGLRHRQRRDRARPRRWSTASRGCCWRGADPAAILCVTYTKAAAAEMQRRLFEQLGEWAVATDATLRQALARARRAGTSDLARARRPVRPRPGDAGRPEDPDHPRLLRDAAAALPAGGGRLARLQGAGGRRGAAVVGPGPRPAGRDRAGRGRTALIEPRLRPLLGRARLRAASTTCSPTSPPAAAPSRAYVEALRRRAAWRADVWRRCGFGAPDHPTRSRREAAGGDRLDRLATRGRGACRAARRRSDQKLGAAMAAVDAGSTLRGRLGAVSPPTDGEPRKESATRGVDARPRALAGRRAGRGWARRCDRRRAAARRARHLPRPHPGRRLRRLYEAEKASDRRARLRRPDRSALAAC